MRRKLAVLLALCVAVSAAWVPAGTGTVRAEEAQTAESRTSTEGDFEYEELADDTVKITGYNGSGAEVVIPSEIDGKSVVMIGDFAFSNCGSLTSIEIPDGVTSIGERAFYSCYSLTSIEIPDGVTSIGNEAFRYCSNLKRVRIPTSVTSIGNFAFRDCGEGLCIYCDEGSYAETYATNNGIKNKEKKWQTITVSNEYYNQTEGDDPFAIGATTDGDGELSYESSNESVAVVSEKGIVTLMGAGTADITIRAAETENYEAAEKIITITVNAKSDENENPGTEKRLQTITVNHSSYTKTEGDDPFAIGATTDGDGVLSYESSNESVAAVSEKGIVTLGGAGTADITIRAAETENYEAAEKSITITVNAKSDENENPGTEKRPQTITVNHSSYTKTEGDDPFAIGATTDGDGVLSYESSNESVAVVSENGIVTLIGAGTADITIRAAETENYEAAEQIVIITVKEKADDETEPSPGIVGDSFEMMGRVYQITSVAPDKEVCIKSFGREGQIKDGVLYMPNWVIFEGVEYDVTSIADRACQGMDELRSVRLGENVREIGKNVFAGCSNLKWVHVPESVSSIGEGAFEGCSEGLCMICAEGSAAEEYAAENGIRHKSSDDEREPQKITANGYIKTEGDASFTIKAATDGDGELSYESGNESVAIVTAKGTVFLMGAGTAVITIRAAETENYEAAEKLITITVKPKSGNTQKPGTVAKPQKPPVKKAQSITAASFRKAYGDRPFALGARASGGGALSYAVKDSSVASVDGRGKVTLKGCGVTEITVRAASNSAYLAAEKTVTLTVEPKRLAVTSVKSAKARTLTVKWKRDKAASGYIIECSADRKFKKGVKRYTVKKNKTTSKKIKNLKAGRKYYVRARAYAKAGGGKIKGAYGAAKKAVKVKR